MRTPYKVLYQPGCGELTEKKSRFIATLRPVKTEEEALAFIEETRKKYWDARHNCYAWVIGENGESKRCSDDGEPSQTAGRPMLDVLEGEGIRNVCAVVTRYFGGTLLGTGGLVRAYSGAVQEGLRASGVVTVYPASRLSVTVDYNTIGKLQYLLGQRGLNVLDSQYGQDVTLIVLVPDEEIDSLREKITDLTGARAKQEVLDPVYYGIWEKKVILF